MTHSAEQQRKKDIAMNESLDHHQYSNVMHTRGGKDHEDHKNEDYRKHDLTYHTDYLHAKPHRPSGEPGNDFERPGERMNQAREDAAKKRGK